MKHLKTRTTEVRDIEFVACDFCGGSKHREWEVRCRSSRFEGSWYMEDAGALTLSSGINYPECGDGVRWDLDICPRCFETKIVPLALPERQTPETWNY